MTSTHQLKHVADDELLRRLFHLVQQSRRVEALLVAHIGEVDTRRLYLRDAASMFAYCTEILRLSEHEAYARITVARAARRYPVLIVMLADGRLHLTGIGKLVPHLTEANHADVLARATHKTTREIEELVAEIAPKPDVPAAVRLLSVGVAPAAPHVPRSVGMSARCELGSNRVGFAQSIAPHPGARPATTVAPLSPARYQVQFTASAELRDKLERLQALTGEDLATAIETAVTKRLERLEAKRFAVTKAPRKTLGETVTARSSRYIPAPVRRAVRQRDGNRCTFVSRSGGRCTERRGLEFHHRHPYGRGGNHSLENVCLLCRQHNLYLAEREYGRERIEKYRRHGDRVREEPPAYMHRTRMAAVDTQRRENARPPSLHWRPVRFGCGRCIR